MKNYNSKQRFYINNQDIFLQYFDEPLYYFALVSSCNFEKIEKIIKENK